MAQPQPCHHLFNLSDWSQGTLAPFSFLLNEAKKGPVPGPPILQNQVTGDLMCPMMMGTDDKRNEDESTHCILSQSV